jgi:hypothetical protein
VREAGKEEVRQTQGVEREHSGFWYLRTGEREGCEILPSQWVRDLRDVGSDPGSGSGVWEDEGGTEPEKRLHMPSN